MSEAEMMIDEVARTLYAVFDTREGRRFEADPIRAMFVQGASIIKADCGEAVVMDVESFIAPRLALLNGGPVSEFEEHEEAARTEIFGGMARRISRYRKSWREDGQVRSGAGVKYLSLVLAGGDWKIGSLVWQDECEGLSVDHADI